MEPVQSWTGHLVRLSTHRVQERSVEQAGYGTIGKVEVAQAMSCSRLMTVKFPATYPTYPAFNDMLTEILLPHF